MISLEPRPWSLQIYSTCRSGDDEDQDWDHYDGALPVSHGSVWQGASGKDSHAFPLVCFYFLSGFKERRYIVFILHHQYAWQLQLL